MSSCRPGEIFFCVSGDVLWLVFYDASTVDWRALVLVLLQSDLSLIRPVPFWDGWVGGGLSFAGVGVTPQDHTLLPAVLLLSGTASTEAPEGEQYFGARSQWRCCSWKGEIYIK
ncbi:unnamed protein product [Nippostrongylus brasiliensis]|uniref:Secreted protein n=1 Tax=Nippostrongylus brasiliensis TaxID=27835 RepID=A0A0N4Y2C0_NIPBR|nr:unnamed protein product [Nippostrongylus brasiliensis]